MYSKFKFLGHPIHPMIVAFPVAFYTAALVGYFLYAWQGDPFWFRVGFVANVAGVLGAVVAAVFGLGDYLLGIPSGTRAKSTGTIHMTLNVIALLCFAISAWILWDQWGAATPDLKFALVLTAAGFLATAAAGYFGYSLIQNHHVGVELTLEQARLEPAEMRSETTTTGAYRRA